MAEKHMIYGVHVTNRVRCVPAVQRVFTEFGCSIRTRLGLHDVHEDYCSPSGMILLEMTGPSGEIRKFERKLKSMAGVQVKKMIFGH